MKTYYIISRPPHVDPYETPVALCDTVEEVAFYLECTSRAIYKAFSESVLPRPLVRGYQIEKVRLDPLE